MTRKKPSRSIRLQVDGVRVSIRVPESESVPQSPAPPSWSFLAPITVRVVVLLCRSGWLTREEIAAALDESPEGDIRPLLSDLAKRGIVESSGKRGYHIAIPEEADPEQFRARLLAWLERQAT